ncbi:hypothetical protein G9A89_011432 [Geosiphon pyriformis]|nr:hypothetical protein G9A89_011432 [Geosiphon pyriformis]
MAEELQAQLNVFDNEENSTLEYGLKTSSTKGKECTTSIIETARSSEDHGSLLETSNCFIPTAEAAAPTQEALARKDCNIFSNPSQDLKVYDENESLRARISGLAATKAGLQGVDKDKVNTIIYEASKGSAFFENEAKKDAALSVKIEEMLRKYKTLKDMDLSTNSEIINAKLQEYESLRDMSQTIVHIDMDAFYASVEERDNSDLRGKPLGVGGMSMLSTANYEARKYGVRSAMPGFIAKKLCPQIIIVPCHFEKYTAVSKQVQEILARYDPEFCSMGLDEAYLNITGYLDETDLTSAEVVEQIRDQIFKETHLTASAGIGPNKMLAKICSDMNKPNGQYQLPHNRQAVLDFIKELSIRKIGGIGRVTERILNALEIKTCGDLYNKLLIVYKLFSETSFNFLARVALGIGSIEVSVEWNRKSISVERTFAPLHKTEDLEIKLRELAAHLAEDLVTENLEGRNISLKLKLTSFKLFTRAKTIPKYIHSAEDLFYYGKQILEAEFPLDLRLMGLRLSTLRNRDEGSKHGVKRYFPLQDSSSQKKLCIESHPHDNNIVKETNINCALENLDSQDLTLFESSHNTRDVKTHQIKSNENSLRFSSFMEAFTKNVCTDRVQSDASNDVNWECPICNARFSGLSELRMSTHIDFCLSVTKIKEKSHNRSDAKSKSKRKTILGDHKSLGRFHNQSRQSTRSNFSLFDFYQKNSPSSQ